MARTRRPGSRARTVLDVVLVLWTAWWLWAGITVGDGVRDLADLGNTAGQLGRAVTSVGDAIATLPLVGDQLRGPAGAVHDAGRQAVASAQSARTSGRRLGVLLGLTVAAVPTVPLLLLYLPGRIASARERQALARALRRIPGPQLDDVLARRALVHLPYHVLGRVSDDPVGDIAAGRSGALADAELEWYGVTRPRR